MRAMRLRPTKARPSLYQLPKVPTIFHPKNARTQRVEITKDFWIGKTRMTQEAVTRVATVAIARFATSLELKRFTARID